VCQRRKEMIDDLEKSQVTVLDAAESARITEAVKRYKHELEILVRRKLWLIPH